MTSKKFYAVFDTNVLVSALMSARQESPTVLLLDYVLDERIVLLYNDDILNEYDEVLHREKFHFSEERIQSVLALVQTGLHLDPTTSDEDFPDSDDRVFYEVALSKDGSYVVTGNLRHFPRKPIVVSPADGVNGGLLAAHGGGAEATAKVVADAMQKVCETIGLFNTE